MAEVTFHIIEGPHRDLPYEAMKHDYYNTNMLNREIMEKYGLGYSQWRRFIKELKEEGLSLKNTSGRHEAVKNYYFEKKRGKWKIQKSIHGRKMFFGYCDTEEEAQEKVAVLKKNRWDGTL